MSLAARSSRRGARTIWDLPVVATPALDQGDFLVGAFATAAQVFDRLQPEVLVSSEDRDNFIKNMLTVRAEAARRARRETP